eukprot:1201991-Lingulodinium_polyedra.AAC.1
MTPANNVRPGVVRGRGKVGIEVPMASSSNVRPELARGDIQRSRNGGRNRAGSAGIEATVVTFRITITANE